MEFLGIGVLELLVIIVIALVVLGPIKTMNMAKSAGRMLGQVRRAMGDLSKVVEEEERELGRATRLSEDPDFEVRSPPEDRG